MTAGIFQLVARGEQDEYITGNPQISFYKYAFRKHTNFAMETKEMIFNDVVSWGSHCTSIIHHHGDMLSDMFLQIKIPRLASFVGNENAAWVRYLGLAMIRKVEIEIGGQVIDSHTGEWIFIHNQLTLNHSKRNGYDYMIGFDVDPRESKVLYIPLSFWFCNHSGLALPLIALSFHEVKVRVHLRPFKECVVNATYEVPITSASVLCNYVYLDLDERKALTNLDQEYVIDQVQSSLNNATYNSTSSIDLHFSHPVKEIVWVVQKSAYRNAAVKDWFNFTYHDNLCPIESVVLQVNGAERFAKLSGEYFNLVQPYQHHTSIPDNGGICVYSFSIHPESHQASGTMNFSCVDNAILKLTYQQDYMEDGEEIYVNVYCLSYNVIHIKDGTLRLKFQL